MENMSIKTSLTPANLFLSKTEFNTLVAKKKKKWIEDNQNSKYKERSIRYWIKVSPENVNPIHIEALKKSYEDRGWNKVEVIWVNDRTTSLMVFLSMNN